MRTYDVTVEYLTNPLGIDVRQPHFGWKMEDDRPGAAQSAYEITVSSDGRAIWASGRVNSSASHQIEYGGPELSPRTRYDVRVQTFDREGVAGTPGNGWFETGLLKKIWRASWVRGPRRAVDDGEAYCKSPTLPPVCYFRKDFDVKGQPVRARLYATALGMFEGYCNGQKVSDECFAPGWTDYYNRVQYRTYDVTGQLAAGRNALGFKLASGWYSGRIGNLWNGGFGCYGTTPKLRAMLVCDYADGHSETVGTDGSWSCSVAGPEIFSDIYDGEKFNAQLALDDFATAGFASRGWEKAYPCGAGIALEGAAYQPVRRQEELAPVKITRPKKGRVILDFGQNFAGREHFKCSLPAGKVLILRHGEMLNADGTLYVENLRSALATTTYISDGTEREYEPTFTFYGFRYLEVRGDLEGFDPASIRAHVLHTDMKRTGEFSCSNDKLNKLYHNLVWGQKSNYLDVPTDCPQRDERLGWTGDAQAFIRAASYNFQVGAFFTKYLKDLELTRNEFGEYAPFSPDSYRRTIDQSVPDGAAGWADAGLICPAEIFRKYGDRAMLERHFEAMANFVRVRAVNSNRLIDNKACYGDWLNIGAPLPPELTGTAFFAHSADLMRGFAEVLGKTAEAEEFAALFADIKKVYAENFLDDEGRLKISWHGTARSADAGDSKGVPLSCRTQTGALLSLHFQLLPEASRAKVAADLAADITARGTHLSTGFLGTPYLAPVLIENGYRDLAYNLLEQTTYPSWLYSVEQGATTIWERWNSYSHENGFGEVGMNSFNHYAYGAVGDFMYEYIAGITPREPGFRKFAVAPRPGGTLTHAQARYQSEYGWIESSWRIEGGNFTLEIAVPPNSECLATLPDGTRHTVGAGRYVYECKVR